jgi:3-mercaptopyruvate sulfurtransferase SseA
VEPQDKVLVSTQFLETEHGRLKCVECHLGDERSADKEAAHAGMIKRPGSDSVQKTCGRCHPEETESARLSLHASTSTFSARLRERSSPDAWGVIDPARERHCGTCHTGCGGCHVSRPTAAEGGFIAGHAFHKRPDPVNQCTGCHGSRVGNEFFGKRGMGDVHAEKHGMDCISCHGFEEMHAQAPEGIRSRYDLPQARQCADCHPQTDDGIREHALHRGKVQCQVCHSQSYTNCVSCHVGLDPEGLSYHFTERDFEGIKIGLNPDPATIPRIGKWILVRHVPASPALFDHYAAGTLVNFDALPTWLRTSPHNIRRRTWQTAQCDNCHGRRELFLSASDLQPYETTANKDVVVPDSILPGPREKRNQELADPPRFKPLRIVSPEWVRDNMGRTDMVIVDARPDEEYARHHIPGALQLDPMRARNGLRGPWKSSRPANLLPPARLSKIMGEAGISDSDHIVVYGYTDWRPGMLLSVLEYLGARRISFLEGGIKVWRERGYSLSSAPVQGTRRSFAVREHPEFIAGNDDVQAALGNPDAVIIDTRSLDFPAGLSTHSRAARPGHIPGAIKLPFSSLYMDNGLIKSPQELMFLLREQGVTPDKTVILTCDTGALAGAAFFMLRSLGFPDVKVHDESWVGWSQEHDKAKNGQARWRSLQRAEGRSDAQKGAHNEVKTHETDHAPGQPAENRAAALP